VFTKSLKRVQIKDADQGIVEAVFSTFDVIDSDGDVTRKGAFTDGAAVVISAYGHQSWDGALPVGKGVINEVGNEAVLTGQFFVDTIHGLDTFNTVKHLSEDGLQEWSYSLENVEAERGTFAGKNVRFINAVSVKEVSPVLRGAGPLTRTLDIKSGGKFSEQADIALRDVKQLVEMAVERLTLRAPEGKSISEQTDAYEQLLAALVPLKSAIDDVTQAPIVDVSAEFARYLLLSSGAPIT
jgi:hypothetical protein